MRYECTDVGVDGSVGGIVFAILVFRDAGQAPAMLLFMGGVMVPLFRGGGSLGGGVLVLDPAFCDGDTLASDTLIFLGGGSSGFNFSLSTMFLSTTIQSSSPFSFHGLPFRAGFNFIPSFGGLT